MKQSEVKLKLDNYIGFDDDGYLECSIFLGNGDDPIVNQKFSMKDIIKEFIEIRSSSASGRSSSVPRTAACQPS